MPLLNDPDQLFQGAETNSTAVTLGAPTGRQLTMTSAATLPAINAGDFFEIRNSPDSVNNGLWVEDGGSPTTSSITATKVSGSDPIAGGPDTLDFLGTTGEVKNIMYDTAARLVYLLEKNGLGADGVTGQAVYSHKQKSWKDDAFLIANAPFPMLMIDADAGKALIGQDPSGNNNGWNWEDNVTHSIRTRKLLRSLGWSELDTAGETLAIHFCAITLGSFEDEANDTAYFQLGDDTTVDDTVDFDFAGPVNEAVECFTRLADGAINGVSGVTISTDGRDMTRSDGGNWATDGFLVGGRILLRDSENATHDGTLEGTGFGNGSFLLSVVGPGVDGLITMGTQADSGTGFSFVDGGGGNDQITRFDGGSWLLEGYFVGGVVTVANATNALNDGTEVILAISADGLTIDVQTGALTADTTDNAATFGPLDPTGSPDTTVNAAIDNRNQVTLRLRVRDGDTNGKTFDQSGLVRAGETVLANRVLKFPLANATDLKITEIDANILANTPYTNMTLTIHATPQSLGGGGVLVGGPFNFGFTIDAATGTSEEVHEWISHELRLLTDIDEDADIAIGRTIDAMSRFVGDAAQFGIDLPGNFPRNPQGGGTGVFVSDLAAGSKNTTTMFDNAEVEQSFPIGTPVTLDFNQTLIDDAVAEFTLYFDHTIRNAISDLTITAGTGADGTFDSAASFPASLDAGVGAYVRVSGMTGADAAMNGVYQVTALTSTSQWDVTRHDGATIVTTAETACDVDEHPIDSPDAIIVDTDVPAPVQGLASVDFEFTFAYSVNVQGGRTAATDAFVVARAIGLLTSQFTQSTVATIPSVTATVIPLVAAIERNVIT